jgi:hypothetical protein
MVVVFAIVGAFVALIPGASFILIPMELFMVYMIAHRHGAVDFVPFIVMSAAIVTISTFLKGLATFLHVVPVVGQLANSLVALGFILLLGLLAEQFYAARARR